jgi:hypothetical protein
LFSRDKYNEKSFFVNLKRVNYQGLSKKIARVEVEFISAVVDEDGVNIGTALPSTWPFYRLRVVSEVEPLRTVSSTLRLRPEGSLSNRVAVRLRVGTVPTSFSKNRLRHSLILYTIRVNG